MINMNMFNKCGYPPRKLICVHLLALFQILQTGFRIWPEWAFWLDSFSCDIGATKKQPKYIITWNRYLLICLTRQSVSDGCKCCVRSIDNRMYGNPFHVILHVYKVVYLCYTVVFVFSFSCIWARGFTYGCLVEDGLWVLVSLFVVVEMGILPIQILMCFVGNCRLAVQN